MSKIDILAKLMLQIIFDALDFKIDRDFRRYFVQPRKAHQYVSAWTRCPQAGDRLLFLPQGAPNATGGLPENKITQAKEV